MKAPNNGTKPFLTITQWSQGFFPYPTFQPRAHRFSDEPHPPLENRWKKKKQKKNQWGLASQHPNCRHHSFPHCSTPHTPTPPSYRKYISSHYDFLRRGGDGGARLAQYAAQTKIPFNSPFFGNARFGERSPPSHIIPPSHLHVAKANRTTLPAIKAYCDVFSSTFGKQALFDNAGFGERSPRSYLVPPSHR